MFETLHGVDGKMSSMLSTILSFVPIFACPIFGYLIDKIKGNAWWSFVGCILSCIGHIILAIPKENFNNSAIIPIIFTATMLLGIGYSMVGSCVWTLMSLSVNSKSKNIAYGIMQAFQHLGMIIGAKIAGGIVDGQSDPVLGYRISEIFFMICTLVAALTILIYGIGYTIGPNGAIKKSDYEKLDEDKNEECDQFFGQE